MFTIPAIMVRDKRTFIKPPAFLDLSCASLLSYFKLFFSERVFYLR